MAAMIVVMKLDTMDDREKKKVMKIVSKINGIDSIAAEPSAQKLTVVCGSADPVCVVTKVRKHCRADVISMEAPKDDKKKKEEEEKKKKEEEEKKVQDAIAANWACFNPYLSRPQYYCYPYPMEEMNRNPCVIC